MIDASSARFGLTRMPFGRDLPPVPAAPSP